MRIKLLILLQIMYGFAFGQHSIVLNFKESYSYPDFATYLHNYCGLNDNDRNDITEIELQGFNFCNALPFTAKDFPNLERLEITDSYVIYDLKGIETFEKLKYLSILFQDYDISIDANGYTVDSPIIIEPIKGITYNVSRIWNLKNLEELELSIPTYIFGNTISNLMQLKKLRLCSLNFPYEEILKLSQLQNFEFDRYKSANEAKYFIRENFFLYNIVLDEIIYLNRIKELQNKIHFNPDSSIIRFSENIINIPQTPNTGKYELYYKTGKKAVEGYFKNGIRDSIWKYYDDSIVRNEINFSNTFSNNLPFYKYHESQIEVGDTIEAWNRVISQVNDSTYVYINGSDNPDSYPSKLIYTYSETMNQAFCYGEGLFSPNYRLYDFNNHIFVDYYLDEKNNLRATELYSRFGEVSSLKKFKLNAKLKGKSIPIFIESYNDSIITQYENLCKQYHQNAQQNTDSIRTKYSKQIEFLNNL